MLASIKLSVASLVGFKSETTRASRMSAPSRKSAAVPRSEQPHYSRKTVAFPERTGKGGSDFYQSWEFDWRGQFWDHYLVPCAANDAASADPSTRVWQRKVFWPNEGIPLSALSQEQFYALDEDTFKYWGSFALSQNMAGVMTAVAEAFELSPDAWSCSMNHFLDNVIDIEWDGASAWSKFEWDCFKLYKLRDDHHWEMDKLKKNKSDKASKWDATYGAAGSSVDGGGQASGTETAPTIDVSSRALSLPHL
jgi:hypothetical protein